MASARNSRSVCDYTYINVYLRMNITVWKLYYFVVQNAQHMRGDNVDNIIQ